MWIRVHNPVVSEEATYLRKDGRSFPGIAYMYTHTWYAFEEVGNERLPIPQFFFFKVGLKT